MRARARLLVGVVIAGSAVLGGGFPFDSATRAEAPVRSIQADPVCPVDSASGTPVAAGEEVTSAGLTITLDAPDLTLGANSLLATVTNAAGEPVEEAMVFVTIQMPAMDHGISAYPATEIEPGRYRAEDVSLGMAGEWRVTVEVIRQARAPALAPFRIEVEER